MKSNNQGTPNKPAEAGQGFVEYALILILVGIAVILVVSLMQPAIGDVFSRFVAQAPVAPPSLLTYTPPPTATNTSTPDPDNPNPPDPPPATETATPSQTPTPSETPTASSTPTASATIACAYGPHTVPANGTAVRMQMQDFRCGGPGISFFDLTNDGGPGSGAYRSDYGSEGPDFENTSDSTGGLINLAYTRNGEWVEYEVIAPASTAYTFMIRHAASSGNNPQIQIRTTHVATGVQGDTGTITLGSTGGWQTWQNRAVNVVLFEGTNIVRFNIVSGNGNYNYIDIQTAAPPTATPTPVTPTATTIPTNTPIPPTPPTPVTLTFISNASHDGDVRESGNSNTGGTTNNGRSTIYVGDDGNSNNRQYIGFVSFDTSPIPANAVITSVELRLRQESTRNTPFGDLGLGTLYADIAPFNGFHTSYNLQSQDFQALAAATNVISFNEPSGNLAWATGQLGASHYDFINRTNFTQFKIHFEFPDNDNRTADQFRFYSSNSGAANRPQLIVTYYIP